MRLAIAITLAALFGVGCNSNSDPLPTPHGPASGVSDLGFPTSGDDPQALDEAVLAGDPVRVRALLENGADPNARWSWKGDRFPLQEAIAERRFLGVPSNQAAIVRLLLRHGAEPNARWCPFETRGNSDDSCRSVEGMTPLGM